MAIDWGSAFGSSSSGYGKLGIAISKNKKNKEVVVTAKLYYRSKDSVSDENNKFYYDWDQSAGTLIGAKKINHTSNTNWDEDNKTLIGTYKKTFERKKEDKYKYFSGKCSGLEYGGSSGTHKVEFKIPALEQYTITYHANGGLFAPDEQKYYYGDDITLAMSIPVRPGYVFLGWSKSHTATSASYKNGQTWSGTIAEDTVLYAVWAELFTLTLDANDGTVGSGKSVAYPLRNGIAFDISNIKAVQEGYSFAGWNSKKDGTGTMYSQISITSDTTLYAIYEKMSEESVYVRNNGTYLSGSVYQKVDGTYQPANVSVKSEGKYRR